MKIAPAELRARDIYTLMTSLIIPRPIAWVGTRSPEGVDNLAPFSYFMGVSSAPPRIALSVARGRSGALKDTARNILSTGYLTVSAVPERLLDPMHRTSAPFPPEISEFQEAGLTPVDGDRVPAPRPREAPACMECKLDQAIDLGTTHLIVAEVLYFHIDDEILAAGPVVDERKLRPVARLGPAGYAGLGEPLIAKTEGR